MKIKAVSEKNIPLICRELALKDEHLRNVLTTFGAPPLWHRQPGFATLLQIILEQQVSLASARACFDKLTFHIGEVTPETVLELSDADLKAVGFSRQKTTYARHLADSILDGRLDLDTMADLSDAEVRSELTRIKGIGTWTSDIYLLMALLRPDVMPRGDIALHAAWHHLSGEPRPTSDEFLSIAQRWAPHRSTAARLLWHFYLSERAGAKNRRN